MRSAYVFGSCALGFLILHTIAYGLRVIRSPYGNPQATYLQTNIGAGVA